MTTAHGNTAWKDSGGIKIERAKELIQELRREIEAFHGGNPYQLIASTEPESGDHVVRVHILRAPPARWGALIGDAIHNVRSALDLLVWQLVLCNGSVPGKHNAFPIYDTLADFLNGYARQLRGVATPAVKMIRSLNPYEAGNRTLWLLHKLDIIDKHRVLVPAYSSVGTTIIDMTVGIRKLMPEAESLPPMPIGLNWADPSCPVQEGEELWRVKADQREDVDLHPKFTFTIALAPGTPVKKGISIVALLEDLTSETQRVVALFPEVVPG